MPPSDQFITSSQAHRHGTEGVVMSTKNEFEKWREAWSWEMLHDPGLGAALRVAHALMWKLNRGTRTTWYSERSLAKELKCSKTLVHKHIVTLIERGHLQAREGPARRKGNIFHVYTPLFRAREEREPRSPRGDRGGPRSPRGDRNL